MEDKEAIIIFSANGHRNILATHKSTMEITKDNHLTKHGNCIIGVKSRFAVSDLPSEFLTIIKRDDVKVTFLLEAGGFYDELTAKGSKDLQLGSVSSLVIRRSNYIDERTIAIYADKAAINIDRNLIKYLRLGGKLRVTMFIQV